LQPPSEELLAFMTKHKFETISDFKGHSLRYFSPHADLVNRRAQSKAAAANSADVTKETNWKGDTFVKQSDGLSRT
jgi:hypothetical protein